MSGPTPHRHPELVALLGATSATVPRYTAGTRPTAGADWLGKFIRVKDSDAEQLQICLQQSGGGYEWVIVAYASQ